MASIVPPPSPTDTHSIEPAIPVIPGPQDLVDEYLRLVEERRGIEERLAYVRSELELVAAHALKEDAPRARFLSAHGTIGARLSPTCVFDRSLVARELQRMGKLAEVAILQGPGLARYLAKEPIVAARLGNQVRMRRSIILSATDR